MVASYNFTSEFSKENSRICKVSISSLVNVLFYLLSNTVVRVLAEVVATKLILLFLSFYLFLSSFHLLFSQKEFAYDFEFLHAF